MKIRIVKRVRLPIDEIEEEYVSFAVQKQDYVGSWRDLMTYSVLFDCPEERARAKAQAYAESVFNEEVTDYYE